jgi:hypothetical protein
MALLNYRFTTGIAAFMLLCAPGGAWSLGSSQRETAQITELLDALIQPRFQKDGGVFGMRRVVKSPGHEEVGALTDQSAWDRKQLDRIESLRHDYRVSLLQLKHPPGRYRKGEMPPWGAEARVIRSKTATAVPDPGPTLVPMIGPDFDRAFYDRLHRAAVDALPQMYREGTATKSLNSWMVTLRPVRASKQSCVGCHRGAKLGDTLGVLVYSVSQKPAPSASAGPEIRQPARRAARRG